MIEAYERELMGIRICDLAESILNLYAYAQAHGDEAECRRLEALRVALVDFSTAVGASALDFPILNAQTKGPTRNENR